MRFVELLCLLILISMPLALTAGESADPLRPPDHGWRQEHRDASFAIYSRKAPSSRFRENLLVGLLDQPPEACFRAATDYEHYPEFMPYCRYVREVDRKQLGPHRTRLHVFLYLDLPVLSNRYLTSKYTDEKDITQDGATGCYLSTWETVKSGPYHRTPASPDIRAVLPGVKGIEIDGDHGYWLFEPLEQGTKTRMVYYEWSDPGGRIPAWINNIGGETSLKDLWKRFRERCSR
jgi:hypothetical protein